MAIVINPPMTEALSSRIQPKLVEIGWSAGGEDSSPLSEYICLMLQNGKSQDQIAAELSGDLLGLDPGDRTATEFSRWLFKEVEGLAGETQQSGNEQPAAAAMLEKPQQENGSAIDQGNGNTIDHDMADFTADSGETGQQDGVPTAPKAMRQPQGRRLFSQLTKAMDRPPLGPFNRPGQQALDRVDTRKRDMTRGSSRNNMRGQIVRPQGRMNGRPPVGLPSSVFANMNPQQQMQIFQLYQQQSRIIAPYNTPGPQLPHMGGPVGHNPHPHTNPYPQQHPHPQQHSHPHPHTHPLSHPHRPHTHPHPHPHPHPHSHPQLQPRPQHPAQMHIGGHMGVPPVVRGPMMGETYANNFAQLPRATGGSLFDRIQTPSDLPRNNNSNNHHHHHRQNGGVDTSDGPTGVPVDSPSTSADSSAMDQTPDKSVDEIACKFAAGCTKPECPFGHPTPAAIPGKPVAFAAGEKCSYGTGCKNRKCTGSHPSPASAPVLAVARPAKLAQECKFFPNCANPACPFKHPDMPACRNGANCTRPGCHFTHTEVPCKFSPCLNPNCIYKHEDGQQKGFDNKVWMNNGPTQKREHVSERKFVNDEEEELIIPGQIPGQTPGEGGDMDTAPFDDVE